MSLSTPGGTVTGSPDPSAFLQQLGFLMGSQTHFEATLELWRDRLGHLREIVTKLGGLEG